MDGLVNHPPFSMTNLTQAIGSVNLDSCFITSAGITCWMAWMTCLLSLCDSSREAARQCRRKKKEYVKCLENRVAVLETQNKTLIEELRAMKDIYRHKVEWSFSFQTWRKDKFHCKTLVANNPPNPSCYIFLWFQRFSNVPTSANTAC